MGLANCGQRGERRSRDTASPAKKCCSACWAVRTERCKAFRWRESRFEKSGPWTPLRPFPCCPGLLRTPVARGKRAAHQKKSMAKSNHNWGRAPWKIRFHAKWGRLPQHVDVAIVGGGFTGLTAAAYVKRGDAKRSVLLLEAERIGNGASGRTGGMVLAETAAGALPGLGDVLAGYRKILRELGVDGDLDLRGAWEIARGARSLEGGKVRPLRRSPIDWSDSGRVRAVQKVPGGTIDPGKVVRGLARAARKAGAKIAENARVVRLEFGTPLRLHLESKRSGKIVRTIVAADRVLLATSAGAIAEEILGARNPGEPKLTFALATAPLTKRQIAAIGMNSGRPFYSVDLPYLWGRLLKNRGAIFGSGLVPGFAESLRKRGAKGLWSGLEREDVRRGDSARRLKTLEQRVRGLHPALTNIRVTHRWSGPILITRDFVPVFRAHSKSKNVIVLGGFSGHGVAQSVYLGRRAAEVLLGRRAPPKWPGR